MDIQAGIIGYGGMGGVHGNLISRTPGVALAGVCDIRGCRQQLAVSRGYSVYPSIASMLADDRISLIVIALPNDLHKAVAIQAMQAGKHVICEKPVALNSTEYREMVGAAEQSGVFFTVHQNRRQDKDFRIIRQLYDRETLGDTFRIESRVQGSRGIPGDWRNQKARGGGMVLDWGVHLIDQMFQITGERRLESVYATLDYVTNQECDDGFTVLAAFEGGLQFRLEVGTSHFISLPRWYMLGKNGSAVIEDWDLHGKIVMVSDWENREAVPIQAAAGWTKTMAPRTADSIREYPLPAVQSSDLEFYRNVVAVLHGDAEPLVKTQEVIRVMRFMEAVFRSAEENRLLPWEEADPG